MDVDPRFSSAILLPKDASSIEANQYLVPFFVYKLLKLHRLDLVKTIIYLHYILISTLNM